MIPRSAANRFADRVGVDLPIAQQEVVLLYALDALHAAGVLRRLVFKGGTYLRLRVTGDAGRRFGFLRNLTPFERALAADGRRHALRSEFERPLERYA